jgi:ureidoacrylate peracid hydrolase
MATYDKVLVLIDVQKEYTATGRPFCLSGIEESLGKIKLCLEYARQNNYKIIHVRHIQDGDIFSKNNCFAGFIEGFEPLENEDVITKSNFSAFTSDDFVNAIGSPDKPMYIVGYGSTMCCLSTIVDGYHRGYNILFIEDASYAKKTVIAGEKDMHRFATEIIKNFAKVITGDHFLTSY